MAKNNITDLYKNLTSQDSSNNSNVGKLVGAYLGDYTRSRDSDKDAQENLISMILGQEFAERSAEKQNQYNIEAEQRERQWNSIGAQAERARSAGISPIAALGMSSGSSIGTQVASASGSGTNSSTRSRQSDIAALNSAIDQVNTQIRERQLALEEQRVENETNVAEAEVAKKESETIAQQFENQIRPMLNELKLDDIETQKIKNSVERAVNSGGKDSLAYKQAMQELENLVKDTAVKDEIKNLTNAQIETETAKQRNIDASTEELGTRSHLNVSKSALNEKLSSYYEESTKKAKAEGKLISANTEEAKSRKVKIDKEVERIGKQNNLTDQQIKQIKNQIALNWAKFGVNTGVQISQEARAWVNPFAKGAKMQDNRSAESWSLDTGYNPFDY